MIDADKASDGVIFGVTSAPPSAVHGSAPPRTHTSDRRLSIPTPLQRWSKSKDRTVVTKGGEVGKEGRKK